MPNHPNKFAKLALGSLLIGAVIGYQLVRHELEQAVRQEQLEGWNLE